jgi:hypothetical protein
VVPRKMTLRAHFVVALVVRHATNERPIRWSTTIPISPDTDLSDSEISIGPGFSAIPGKRGSNVTADGVAFDAAARPNREMTGLVSKISTNARIGRSAGLSKKHRTLLTDGAQLSSGGPV